MPQIVTECHTVHAAARQYCTSMNDPCCHWVMPHAMQCYFSPSDLLGMGCMCMCNCSLYSVCVDFSSSGVNRYPFIAMQM